jgi:hypothetical protein
MALITNATTGWSSPVTLTANEVWQSRRGAVYVSTTATPAANDGIALHEMDAVQFSNGLTVRYRKEGSGEALIAREVV